MVANATLMGANAVVTRDVPAHALMTGVPARRTGWMCECGVKLAEGILDMTCAACGRRYQRKTGAVVRADDAEGGA